MKLIIILFAVISLFKSTSTSTPEDEIRDLKLKLAADAEARLQDLIQQIPEDPSTAALYQPGIDYLMEGHMKQVVFVFHTSAGDSFSVPSLWQRWYEDTLNWLWDWQFETSPSVPYSNPKRFKKWLKSKSSYFDNDNLWQSSIIRGVVHMGNDEYDINKIPFWLRPYIDTDHQSCQKVNCRSPALKFALERHPDAHYFIFVDVRMIPIKKFKHIYEEVMIDGRSRFDLLTSCLNCSHFENFGLSRDHAKVLASHSDEWLSTGFGSNYQLEFPAETSEAMKLLNTQIGEPFAGEITTYFDLLNASRNFYHGCRSKFNCSSDKYGEEVVNFAASPFYPSLFRTIKRSFLTHITAAPKCWFFLGIEDGATLVGCAPGKDGCLVENFLTKKLELQSS